MELTIQGRNVTISDRFREYVETKVARFEELGDKVQRIEIKVLKENPQPGHDGMRVEATVIGRGPVVRAEARGDDRRRHALGQQIDRQPIGRRGAQGHQQGQAGQRGVLGAVTDDQHEEAQLRDGARGDQAAGVPRQRRRHRDL